MNILVVHETEYINKVVFEYQIIPELWASKGHRVYVLDYPSWRKKHLFDFGALFTEYKTKVKKANKKAGITLIRPGIIKIPVLSRLIAFLSYYYLLPKLIKKHRIDVIFQYSVPTNGLQTLYWAKQLNIPVHFRLLDVLHQLVPSKNLSVPTKILERRIYPAVDEMTAITPKLVHYAVSMGADPATTSYVPSGADSDHFHTGAKDKTLLESLGISKSDKVILFAGTLYNFSGLDKILNYFGRYKRKFRKLKLLIIGHGEQKETLRDIVNKYQIGDKVILTGFIKYENLADYIRLADICINPFAINDVTNIIFPGKIYQYLACGKPVIATRLAGVLDIFPDNNGKYGIYYYNEKKPKELFDLIETIPNKTIRDTCLSLQEIADQLEKSFLTHLLKRKL